MTASLRRLGRSRRPVLERLEPRCLCAVAAMTAAEVHLHEVVNWIRAHPAEAAARYEVPLNQGLPPDEITPTAKQPLARHDLLRTAMQGHLDDMLEHDFFAHTGSNGSTFQQRIDAAGYADYNLIGENIAWWGTTGELDDLIAVADSLVEGWFESPTHRSNLLLDDFHAAGTSLRTGDFVFDGNTYHALMGGQDFGTQPDTLWITGNGCRRKSTSFDICDVRYPLRNVSVVAVNTADQTERAAVTGPSGEFDLPLYAGHWEITLSGGDLLEAVAVPAVPLLIENIKLDFVEAAATWQNPADRNDVTGDTFVAANDVLLIVNRLNAVGPGALDENSGGPPYYDVSGDGFLAAQDALLVINFLNSRPNSEGEAGLAFAGRSPSFVLGKRCQPYTVLRGLCEPDIAVRPSAAGATDELRPLQHHPIASDQLPKTTRTIPHSVASPLEVADRQLADELLIDLAVGVLA